jgi:enoyl-CoA hydratase/carnithine racemase
MGDTNYSILDAHDYLNTIHAFNLLKKRRKKMYQYIEQEKVGSTLILIINREEQTNKLNIACMDEIVDALDQAEKDASCKAIILTAKGEYFCNGGELGDYRVKSPLEIREFGNAFIQLHTAITQCTKAVIAAVQGHALGGGFSLVEACDLAVAAEEATFAVPEITWGLAPMMALTGASRVLPRKEVMRLSLLGESISAEEAEKIGLINQVCTKEELMEQSLAYASKIADHNPTAIYTCKKLYYEADALSYQKQLETGLGMLITLLKSEDAMESLTAKEENRQPVWRGK